MEVFEVASIPGKPFQSTSYRLHLRQVGLFIYPSLLPPEIQLRILDKLLHRDLCNTEHKTNVHLHHHVPSPPSTGHDSPSSYFDPSSREIIFKPKDPAVHKSFTTQQFLDKKLRWMTLGGQYDWTNKVYPSGPPPPFPPDIKRLIEDVFPMKAEAAIVNLYSPGDTLSLHRDVSEECDQPLVSISIGCDGIFVVGIDGSHNNGEPRFATIRLRSGDAVLMSGESRFAWHGVPKVLEGTCPGWLQDWPFRSTSEDHDCGSRFEHWQGWMKGKRVNLNVRQMFA
jgi:DNA alkylation damage repair protein AlkB